VPCIVLPSHKKNRNKTPKRLQYLNFLVVTAPSVAQPHYNKAFKHIQYLKFIVVTPPSVAQPHYNKAFKHIQYLNFRATE
jgi:hypothetical protein